MTTADDLRTRRRALLAMVDRLAADHHDVPAGRLMALVAVCRSELERAGASASPALIEATESRVRRRLAQLTPHVAR